LLRMRITERRKKMNSDITLIICGMILIILFGGEPDLVDAIVKNISRIES